MKMALALVSMAACLAMLGACDRDRMSEKGFRLPDGDAAAGRDTFAYMGCVQCHTIDGEALFVEGTNYEPYVDLGGPVSRVKTYGELVTAIINPPHELADGYPADLVSEDGVSNMYVYSRYMTVQELTDLVMYIQPFYEVVVPNYQYRIYP